jgi:glucose/arabinose dehydrogenase
MLRSGSRASRGIRRNYIALIFFVFALQFLVQKASAGTLPAGFQETVIFSGLTQPTAIRFASDGRIFVAEKRGVIKVFDSLTDTTPDIFADLNKNVYNFWDRGLLGLALHPNFPATPYVYVLYSYDADIGGTAPKWGTEGVYSDPCPSPPGATGDGCVVSARLSRLTANGNFIVPGSETVFAEDWCQQYPSHSIGTLGFGADGALYVSGGDGASFNFVDYGQDGSPLNPCGDPPSGVGGVQTPPTAEGGALRAQDLRTPSDSQTLDGTILRVDPMTGQGLPNNPLYSSTDSNTRRVIAYGFRNPFRFTVRPGTNEIWIGDVGWNDWEEINFITNPIDSTVEDFGWPCYEGNGKQAGYDAANLNICENLYPQAGAVFSPYFSYNHSAQVVPGESCPAGSSSISGLAFYTSGSYPNSFAGGLFFSDYSRNCIWIMYKGADGLPNPQNIATFDAGASSPVDVQIGTNGDLFYADFDGGNIRRIQFTGSNQPPVAVATANPTSGNPPLTVNFNGSGSSDPDAGDTLTYAWDLDGDGQFDDGSLAQVTFTYTLAGNYTATLKVTDNHGLFDTDSITITVGNNSPTATIVTPSPTTTWQVGQVISFSGTGTDPEDGNLPASAFSWSLVLYHCPSNCHTHPLQDFVGVKSGSFTAPDHEYPSYLVLQLTVTDSKGAKDMKSVQLNPRTVSLTFKTKPGSLHLVVGSTSSVTPFSRTVIIGSTNTISAPAPQTKGPNNYFYGSWSDGGAQTHVIVAPTKNKTYTADYVKQ